MTDHLEDLLDLTDREIDAVTGGSAFLPWDYYDEGGGPRRPLDPFIWTAN